MNFTQEQLDELEGLGELQFSIQECAIIMQFDEMALMRAMEENKPIRNTYERGRLKASAAVRKAILQQAKQGSTPAQKQMLALIKDASIPKPNTQLKQSAPLQGMPENIEDVFNGLIGITDDEIDH